MSKKIFVLVSVVVGVVILIVDIFFAGEYSLAGVKYLILAVICAIYSVFKIKDMEIFKTGMIVTSLFIVLTTFSYCFPYINNITAQRSGSKLVEAIENYKTKNGSYPKSLDDLKPEFITRIPKAKYTMLWNNFYWVDNSLIYINTPPFNLMRYDFTNKKWVWCGREAFVKILQNKD